MESNISYTIEEKELRKLGEIIPLRHMKDLMSDDRVFYQLHTGYKEKVLPFFKHVPYKVMIEQSQHNTPESLEYHNFIVIRFKED